MRSAPFYAAFALLAGCAASPSRPSPTTLTAASVSPGAAGGAAEAAEPAETAAKASAPDAPPAGQLVCRATVPLEGQAELFLEWNGEAAKGSIRRVAPSGMVYVQPVRAERYKGVLVVDEPGVVDLATHAAVVGERGGKRWIRLGDSDQPFVPCE